MNPLDLVGPQFTKRLGELLAQGVDPLAYAVSSKGVRRVVHGTDTNQAVKDYVLNGLEPLLKQPIVYCVLLGLRVGDLACNTDDPVGFKKISDNLRDLDNLPFVIENGEQVRDP